MDSIDYVCVILTNQIKCYTHAQTSIHINITFNTPISNISKIYLILNVKTILQ